MVVREQIWFLMWWRKVLWVLWWWWRPHATKLVSTDDYSLYMFVRSLEDSWTSWLYCLSC